MEDFLNIGPFMPLTVDGHGTVLREVAPAQFWLARASSQNEPLILSVALIRDSRKSAFSPPSEEELPRSWWADIRHEEVAWWIDLMARTWDLRSYTGTMLAVLTGRERAYSQRYTERFLARLAHARAAECLTEAITT